ncbi:uncharacterized protein FOBCDRAFT_140488 [Fusarium oxysporum Fo47]|uniref:uncharacterized protein n=1 Tax=Fusarium oxysporum Fo47 TaxID=660027 RepID=UPI002869B65F|nr:uncharacterized protein FOBCDRAFT_140488 [Fusarium oxysporum Fo47]QKD57540.2 hypothetical protein FOBCDRAFT_140488 [Fusarium oxysporum Fo47]
MGAQSLHPSQRLFSCDVCRKQRSRCQRINQTDAKCTKCTILGLQCTGIQQKNMGRLRRMATSTNPTSATERFQAGLPNQSISPSHLQQNASSMEGWDFLNWSGMLSPASSPTEPHITTMDDAFWAVPTWPTNIMDTFDQTFLSWNTDYAPKGANSLFSGGPGFSSTISSAYALETPPQTVAPQVTDTTSFPMNITKTSGFPEDIDPSDVMFELSKINLDLHIRIAAIKKNKTTLDFDSIVYQKSPLSIDNITLAEFSIIVSQEFLIVLTKLLNTRPCTDQLCASPTTKVSSPKPLESQHRKDKNKFQDVSTPPLSHPSATLKSLPAPTVLIITSILIQLVSIYELILDHLTTRIERIPTEPLTPIPGLTFGGRPLATACTQCMTFSELLATLLKGIERVLGIIPISEGRKVGLLSLRQIEVLRNELDKREEIVPGHIIMTPSRLRRLLGKVADIFRYLH